MPDTDITREWADIKLPPAPELKPVTVDPKTTALLVLDMSAKTTRHIQPVS